VLEKGALVSETTFEVVRRVLVDGLSVDEGAVTLEASLSDDLGADSLDSVELLMSLEGEYGVEIAPAKAEGLKTVEDLVQLVDSLKG
jgi:acyl carrier protein